MKVTIEELEQSDSGVLEFNFEDSPEEDGDMLEELEVTVREE